MSEFEPAQPFANGTKRSTAPSRIIDPSWHPLVTGCPPAWASEWGEDRQGVFVAFTVGEVTQRMRWIPPGRFEMGSPEGEPGRYDHEGPQHTVYLSRGYWLFDTPCTQALWQEVMGSNPSMFQSPDRPVEQVLWDDVQGFLDCINGRIPGLELVLPTEAQWEYACRAGTDSALYTGGIEIKGDAHAPALDPIAWYGGNSGIDFELDSDVTRYWFRGMQFPEEFPEGQAGTHPVGRKDRNPWGLYDMLGNVWEWCADGRRPYDADWKLDPIGPSEAGAERVVRGGSWYDIARYCRSAFRPYGLPDDRDDGLGFRCARVQAAP